MIKLRLRLKSWAALLTAVVIAIGVPAAAVVHAEDEPGLSKTRLESFADEFIGNQLPLITGAVVSVVDREGVLLERGYGYADIETQRPMDPKGTTMRLASISKVFTATAVMQLEEKGSLSLQEDIRKLVPIQLNRDRVLTLDNLMTHTAGFDESTMIAADRWSDTGALGKVSDLRTPELVWEPGKVKGYSNYGMALAGHVVEAVAKEPFADYVKKHILVPLGMSKSGFRLTDEMKTQLSKAYDLEGRPLPPFGVKPFFTPASSLVSTAEDMGLYMRAMLRRGELGGQRILSEDTYNRMMELHAAYHPELGGMAYGYVVVPRGLQVREHTGSYAGWQSGLWLFPDSGLGVFVAINGNKPEFPDEFIQAFLRRFMFDMGTVEAAAGSPAVALELLPGQELEGEYTGTRQPLRTIVAISAILSEPLRIKAVNEHMVMVGNPPNDTPYIRSENGLWKSSRGNFAAIRTGDGIFVQFSNSPAVDYRKHGEAESGARHQTIVALFIGGLLLGATFGLVGLLRRKGMVMILLNMANACYLLFLISLIVLDTSANLFTKPQLLERVFIGILALPVAALLLTIGSALLLLWLSMGRRRTGMGWAWTSISVALMLLNGSFGWYLHYWSMLGWSGLR